MKLLLSNILTVFVFLLAFVSTGPVQWLLFILASFGLAHMILALAKEVSEKTDEHCK